MSVHRPFAFRMSPPSLSWLHSWSAGGSLSPVTTKAWAGRASIRTLLVKARPAGSSTSSGWPSRCPAWARTAPPVVWGHSQGGHAARHVAERWQDLAPDLDLVGVAAGAPPSQFALLSAFLQGSAYQGYLVMAAASMAATYDELDLKAVIDPAKLHLMDELEKGCTGHIFDVFNEIPYEDLLSVDDIFAIPEWNARLLENDTNQLPNQVPVVILHGDLDQQQPVTHKAPDRVLQRFGRLQQSLRVPPLTHASGRPSTGPAQVPHWSAAGSPATRASSHAVRSSR